MRHGMAQATVMEGGAFSRKGRWKRYLPRDELQALFCSWLRERGSLTERLRGCGRFHVEVRPSRKLPGVARVHAAAVAGGLSDIFSEAVSCLDLGPRERVEVREVVLFCDGRPAVFAYTVYSSRIRWPLRRWLRNLGTRSLGDLLFNHPGFARGALQFSRIDHRHPYYEEAAKAFMARPPAFWGRRSIFRFHGQSLLVTEFFAPEFIRTQRERQ